MRPPAAPRRYLTLLSLVMMLVLAGPAAAKNANPGVIPPNAKAFGKSYGEWSGKWWAWAFSMPLTDHPVLDGTGAPGYDLPGSNCDAGQKGKVWFLAGTFGGEATRDCTIPNGKAIFFPILNFEYDNIPLGYPNVPFTEYDEEELADLCEAQVSDPEELLVEVDGRALKNLKGYAVEPTRFSYTVPDGSDNLYGGNFSGTVPDPGAVSCGYYVMLSPLSKGQHEVRIAATRGTFSLDVTYNITIKK